MANRRCFSSSVVESDRFLELPLSAQALYIHLGMNMDDDGFIGGVRKVCGMIGATLDDVQELIDGGFIIVFKSKVVCDRYWTINNTLRNDRYKPTVFQKEIGMINIDTATDTDGRLKGAAYEVKAGCINNIIHDVCEMETKRKPDVRQMSDIMETRCQTIGIPDDRQMSDNRVSSGIQNGNVTEHNITELNPTELEHGKNHVDSIDNPIEEEKEEKIILGVNSSLTSSEVERIKRDFEEFWYSYPNEGKQHRKRALMQFTRLNPYEGLIIKIINALVLWKEDLQQTHDKVISAESWLMNQRWKDYC